MNQICTIAAIALLVLFSAVNLFLPYAIVVVGLFLGLGFACKAIQRSRNRECRLGFC